MSTSSRVIHPTNRALPLHGGIIIQLTWRCNARCAFCGTNSSPTVKAALDAITLRKVIAGLAIRPGRYVELTGGEPFLEWELLVQAAEQLSAAHIPFTIVSNGFWGTSLEVARGKLAALPGLERIVLSGDRYHSEYVPESRLAHIVRAAGELGIEAFLSWCFARGEEPGPQLLGEELRALVATGAAGCHYCPVMDLGRARIDCPEDVIETELEGACSILSKMTVSPEGKYFACCVAPTAAPGGGEALALGTCADGDEEVMHRRFLASPLLVMIAALGPAEVLRLLGEPVGDHRSICGACFRLQQVHDLSRRTEELARDGALLRRLRATMRDLYKEAEQDVLPQFSMTTSGGGRKWLHSLQSLTRIIPR
jgi:hypothetical protein